MIQYYLKHIVYIFISFILFGMTSCDNMLSAIQEEFDSERPIKPVAAIDPAPTLKPKGKTVYLVRGNQASITPIKTEDNHYLLSMKIANSLIAFGGLEETRMHSVNDLIFFNQWSEKSLAIGGLILLKDGDKSLPEDNSLNVLIASPSYDIDTQSMQCILIPQETVETVFLTKDLNSCILLIESYYQEF